MNYNKIRKKVVWFIFGIVFISILFNIFSVFIEVYETKDNNIFELYVVPAKGEELYSYYVALNNKRILHYKIGYVKNNNLLYQIKSGELTQHCLEKFIKDDEVELSFLEYLKILKLLNNIEKELDHEDKPHITTYDATYQYFWFNGSYYNVSSLLAIDNGYNEYYKLTEILFEKIESDKNYNLQSFKDIFY